MQVFAQLVLQQCKKMQPASKHEKDSDDTATDLAKLRERTHVVVRDAITALLPADYLSSLSLLLPLFSQPESEADDEETKAGAGVEQLSSHRRGQQREEALCAMLETYASENPGGVMLILEMKMGSAHQKHNTEAELTWRLMATVHQMCERRNDGGGDGGGGVGGSRDDGDGEKASSHPIILCLSGRSTSHGRSGLRESNLHGGHSLEYDQICHAAHEAGAP